MQKEYGGYLAFELRDGLEYFQDCPKVAFNFGRAALAAALLLRKPSKVYTPLYMCETLTEAYEKIGVPFEFYHIGEDFTPRDVNLKDGEFILWPYYYGAIPRSAVDRVIACYGERLILDNTQAFFSFIPSSTDKMLSIYSCRKFFGVPDGAYLAGNIPHDYVPPFPQGKSSERYLHILASIEDGTNAVYSQHLENEMTLGLEYCGMSALTQRVLRSLDYEDILEKRLRNYRLMSSLLGQYNQLQTDVNVQGAMVYPFLCHDGNLRRRLISDRVYVPQWWKHVSESDTATEWERKISRYLIPLPIDQRYNENDIIAIATIVKKGMKR